MPVSHERATSLPSSIFWNNREVPPASTHLLVPSIYYPGVLEIEGKSSFDVRKPNKICTSFEQSLVRVFPELSQQDRAHIAAVIRILAQNITVGGEMDEESKVKNIGRKSKKVSVLQEIAVTGSFVKRVIEIDQNNPFHNPKSTPETIQRRWALPSMILNELLHGHRLQASSPSEIKNEVLKSAIERIQDTSKDIDIRLRFYPTWYDEASSSGILKDYSRVWGTKVSEEDIKQLQKYTFDYFYERICEGSSEL